MYVDDDEPEDMTARFLNQCIEKYKEEYGLAGLPHYIIKTEFSLDDENWIEMEK